MRLRNPIILFPAIFIIVSTLWGSFSYGLGNNNSFEGYAFCLAILTFPTSYFFSLLATKLFGGDYSSLVELIFINGAGIIQYGIIGLLVKLFLLILKKRSEKEEITFR
jgi:hypothetical protein